LTLTKKPLNPDMLPGHAISVNTPVSVTARYNREETLAKLLKIDYY
jgi:hypothetical protein